MPKDKLSATRVIEMRGHIMSEAMRGEQRNFCLLANIVEQLLYLTTLPSVAQTRQRINKNINISGQFMFMQAEEYLLKSGG